MLVREAMRPAPDAAHLHETARQAAARMRADGVGALPVLDGDRVVGIVTDRDIALGAAADGFHPDRVHVRDVLTMSVAFCFDDHTVAQASAVMEGAQVRRLPVVDRSRELVGMISVDDLAARPETRALAARVLRATVPEQAELPPRTEISPGGRRPKVPHHRH